MPGNRLLFFFRGERGEPLPPFVRILETEGWLVESIPISDSARLHGVLDILRYRGDFSACDVVAANEYFLSWAICLRSMREQSPPKVAALSFNQSRRLLLTGFSWIDRILNRVWRRASLFHVHSKAEAALFARLHDIPPQRFYFSRWGCDLPPHDTEPAQTPPEPYVTMVGRNNRDLGTFCAAVERAGVKGVLITAGYMVERNRFESSANVRLLVDRPTEECLNYIAGSIAHLVLVQDADRGAGHISAVSAMLLGKPQIFSDVAPLSDYLIDNFNGIAVTAGSVQAVCDAITALLTDPILAHRLGSNGRAFALKSMSSDAAARAVADALIGLVANKHPYGDAQLGYVGRGSGD